MSERVEPLQTGQGAVADDRVDLNSARVAALLAQIGTLGKQIEATAQRSVDALRRARSEPDIETWDAATAESLLELADRITAQRNRLDAVLAHDRAQLSDAAARSPEPVADTQTEMDPIGPGMI